MKLIQKSSKTGQGDPILPVGADELYRRSLRLRAEKEIERSRTGEKNK